MPPSTAGSHFVAILGTNQSPLEALLLKRNIMGPSWLRVSNAAPVDAAAQTSWCKVRHIAQVCFTVQPVLSGVGCWHGASGWTLLASTCSCWRCFLDMSHGSPTEALNVSL